jgi:hypothetical protein
VANSGESNNELFNSIKGSKLIAQLNDYHFLKEGLCLIKVYDFSYDSHCVSKQSFP